MATGFSPGLARYGFASLLAAANRRSTTIKLIINFRFIVQSPSHPASRLSARQSTATVKIRQRRKGIKADRIASIAIRLSIIPVLDAAAPIE
jgi:hypothetical protein